MALSYKVQAPTVKIWLLDCLSTAVRSARYSLVTKSTELNTMGNLAHNSKHILKKPAKGDRTKVVGE